jgi:hypothetical protein
VEDGNAGVNEKIKWFLINMGPYSVRTLMSFAAFPWVQQNIVVAPFLVLEICQVRFTYRIKAAAGLGREKE